MNPKISVIVPIYNAENYLRRALDSLKAQSISDFEVIMIDDGSNDSSGSICDQYCNQDSRFNVIHKTNGGVSAARQTGLDAARGEYVIHVDADDWVEPNMLEELYKKAKETDADVVICDYYVNDSNNERYVTQCPSSLDAKTVLGELFQQLHGSCWNKLAKRDCYSNYNIKFPEGLDFCEDLFSNVQIFCHNVTVSYLNKAFYHYFQNNASIVHTITKRNIDMKILYENTVLNYLIREKRPKIAALLVISRLMAYKDICDKGIYTNNELNILISRFLNNAEIQYSNKQKLLIRLIKYYTSVDNSYIKKFVFLLYKIFRKL